MGKSAMKMTKPAKEKDNRQLRSFSCSKNEGQQGRSKSSGWPPHHECFCCVTGPKEGQPTSRPRRPAESKRACTRKITGMEKKPVPKQHTRRVHQQ